MLLLTVFVTLSFNKFTRKEKKIQELKTFRDLDLDLEGKKIKLLSRKSNKEKLRFTKIDINERSSLLRTY